MKSDKIKVLILAGGKGERMQSNLPKVLTKVKGKSMIERLLLAVSKAGIDPRPIIVVGHKKETVMSQLGDKYDYAVQNEQLGTGHAVMSAENLLKEKAEHVLVLYGDHPLIESDTIKKLAEKHKESDNKITMATAKIPDFEGWRSLFYKNFSRIVRDEKGEIIKDVQFRDASESERKITEVNPCFFLFEAKWLWSKLGALENNNAQKQYYLTDLIQIAMREKIKIESISINPHEALGANSKEELEILEKFA